MSPRQEASEAAAGAGVAKPPPGQGVRPLTILQVYHTLAVGGVGSYLMNLGAQLVGRGHRVLVAAPEGEMAARFRKAGIDWRPVRISDWLLLGARRELLRVIEREGVDVVNAHDYSAGPAAYLAARKTSRPYLLTIHCRRPVWQRLIVFYWSPRVLTVSPTLRGSLVRQLGLPPGRVIESFVGVDVARFRPGPPAPSRWAALGLSPGRPVVLHVSRLSKTKGRVARALAEAAPRLAEAEPDLAVLIAGTGEDESRVRAAAERANSRIGREVVRVLGARGDVPDLMQLARVVVGTATVVLEAMASGCPVVAAGKFGFVGPVTPQTFAAARQAFFGDHGSSAPTTAEALAGALLPLLRDDRLRRDLGDWGRRTVAERYSLARMADQMEVVYGDMAHSGGAWGHETTACAW